jgi:DNA-binding GntR family transcriptional regulator
MKKAKSMELPQSFAARADENPLSEDTVYTSIYEAIVEQRLPPGTKLPEEILAEVFGVSRTMIRRALLRLAYDKVVETRPNRGAIVSQPTPHEAKSVFEARRLLETAIIAKAVHHVEPEQIEALRATINEEAEAGHRGDRSTAIRLSGVFHLQLAQLSGNPVYVDFMRELISLTSLIIALYEMPGNTGCIFDEHDGLLDAMLAKDEARAARLMEEHLCKIERRLNLDRQNGAIDLRQIFGSVHQPTKAARRRRAG